MPYCNAAEGKPETVGRVLGDATAAFIYAFILVLMLTHFIYRLLFILCSNEQHSLSVHPACRGIEVLNPNQLHIYRRSTWQKFAQLIMNV